jgi:DNA-binding transcriptional regulator YiaG
MNNSKNFKEGEMMMPAVSFGYKCQECGQGTVREQIFRDYKTRLKGLPLTVDSASIGICDRCGARHFDPSETLRWRTLLDNKYAEAYLRPSDIQDLIKQLGFSMEQFANFSGCTRQSLYNWQRPDRSAPQSRMADLFMRLIRESQKVGAVNVLEFLTEEAGKLGFDLRVSPKSHSKGDIIAFPRRVPATSLSNSSGPLRLAAATDVPDESIVLVTQHEETIGRLFYAYRDATLGVEFIHPVPFVEFDAEILFKDGTQTISRNVKIRDCKAVLIDRTKCTEEEVERVVLLPKELPSTIEK